MISPNKIAGVAIVAVALIITALTCSTTIDSGHVGVKVVFGKVNSDALNEGFHLVFPWEEIRVYDSRQKTVKESVGVPSKDQLTTNIDVSVQYRLDPTMAPKMVQETGNAEQVIAVHLTPKLRSLLREQGKTVDRAEDFFLEETQKRLQVALTEGLRGYVKPKGMIIDDVLIRDIKLPGFIIKAIESKKEREQAAEKQKAELERFKTEQEQTIAIANAEREAAKLEAEKIRELADAEAYHIKVVNEATQKSPAYIQLRQIEAFEKLAQDPNSKMFFFDGGSTNGPIPFIDLTKLQGEDK